MLSKPFVALGCLTVKIYYRKWNFFFFVFTPKTSNKNVKI
jgi:hypothetical protein